MPTDPTAREARLHEQTFALWNMLNASLRAESLSSKALDLILAALRRVDEEARAAQPRASLDCQKCHMQTCKCFVDEMVAAARAEGERAGREAERERIRKYHVSGDEEYGRAVYVEWRGQYYGKGPILWAVTRSVGNCLNHDGEWEREPQPSSRDEAFIERCRWTSFEDALAAAIRARKEEPDGR